MGRLGPNWLIAGAVGLSTNSLSLPKYLDHYILPGFQLCRVNLAYASSTKRLVIEACEYIVQVPT